MSHRIVFIGLWALALVACGSTTEPSPTPAACGPASCGGCCTASGRCERGAEVSACGVGGQSCVDCGSQGSCGQDGRCGAPTTTPPDAGEPPLGCGAIALPLVNGRAQVGGTTVGAERQAAGSCGGIDGREVVYALTLPNTVTANTDLVITVTPRDAAFQPVVYLRQARCDSPQSELNQACIAAHQPGATVQLQTRTTASGSGTYFLVVDGLSDMGGAFDLSVEVGGRAANSCADVLPLTGQRFTVRGSYAGADDSLKPSCGRAGGRDRVYRLETSEPAYLHARVEDGEGVYTSVVAVSDVCGGAERSCGSGMDSGQLAPGTHYVWLDRYVQSFENPGYILRAELVPPPPGDACAQARPLVFSNGAQGGTATDQMDASLPHDDGNWGCAGSSGADLVYTFTTDRTLALRANATDLVGHTLALTVLRAACTQEARVACGSPTLDIAELPAGSYFLWVDGFHQNSGTVKLNATLE